MTVRLIWLGQSGFLLEAAGRRLLIDPYLSEHPNRLIRPPGLDVVSRDIGGLLVTHEHLDHLDTLFLPTLLAASPTLRVVLPAPLVSLVSPPTPRESVMAALPHASIHLDAFDISVVPAIHAVHPRDGYSDGDCGSGARFVGYVVNAGGVTLYHAGDTILSDELRTALRGVAVDFCLLPINGRDPSRERRGIAGNMGPREAVELATELGARFLVPMHWDLFRGNTGFPAEVVRYAKQLDAPLEVIVPHHFTSLDLGSVMAHQLPRPAASRTTNSRPS
jgi:L-ascorbate 6-phosphate lactonase